jgi:branched-chain amino acid transport system permease protein
MNHIGQSKNPVSESWCWALIEQIIIYGAISGGVYALLALGFTLIYGVSRVVNLAHGSFYMLAAYMFVVFGTFGFFGSDPMLASIIALILAVIFVGAVGGITYRLAIHPVIGDEVAVLVVTVSLAVVFQQLMLLGFGATFPRVSWPQGSFLLESTNILGVSVEHSLILAFVVSLVLFASLLVFIAKTKIGKAMRAVSQDREVAMLMGINTKRLYMLTMVISAMLAALAGIFITTSIEKFTGPWLWFKPLTLSFSIVILGGLGSIKGSLLGGFIIAFAEKTVTIMVPEGGAIVGVVPLAVIIAVLLIRPKGLFGKRIEMEE